MYKIELLSERKGVVFPIKTKSGEKKEVLQFLQPVKGLKIKDKDQYFAESPFSGATKDQVLLFKTKKEAEQWIKEYKKQLKDNYNIVKSKVKEEVLEHDYIYFEIRKVDKF